MTATMPHDLPRPGPLWGARPERLWLARLPLERLELALGAALDRVGVWRRHQDRACLARIRAAQARLQRLSPEAVQQTQRALLRDGFTADTLAQGLACAGLAAQEQLGVRPFDAQLLAAAAVLDKRLVEMDTGEGKTLAVALAAAVGALAGMPVHVLTANDHLVERDADALRPLYGALGLRVGSIVVGDPSQHRSMAYGCDVTYVTGKELVFDYLRDGLLRGGGGHVLRGLCMAIVDEADAVLLDQATTPFILSRPAQAGAWLGDPARLLALAATLARDADFTADQTALQIRLTPAGRAQVLRWAGPLTGGGADPALRHHGHLEHLATIALAALHLYRRDRHYLVDAAGRVVMIDAATGRRADGRAWSHGLQQLIEAKEGCPTTPLLESVAQLTYQRFFPRYVRLGGLSGTLVDARAELLRTYGLAVRRVRRRRPCRRVVGPARLFAGSAALHEAIVARLAGLRALGRPVLVAADSVAEADALSAVLAARAIPHALIHAQRDAEEAALVAQAGQRGAITVTTVLAGRGTDIVLGDGVAALGGLHVLNCQIGPDPRVDRQILGRTARQGDPGSAETWLSVDNARLRSAVPATVVAWLRRTAALLPSCAVSALVRLLRGAEAARQRQQRERLIRYDEHLTRGLAFGGPGE